MTINESFLKYAASYSGVDGGDIDAEYWFMGMEWSNYEDIKDDYDEETKTWIERSFPEEEIEILTKDGKEDEKWKLENAMDKLYQKLKLQNKVSGKTIFQKKSNSLKLNLLPLPFGITKHRRDWKDENYDYSVKTGFFSFEAYINGVIEARKNLFAKLLQYGKKPKTIFCFGKSGESYDYENKFLYALTGKTRLKAQETHKLTQKNAKGYNLKVSVYEINTDVIKRIFVCPFPYAYNNKGYKIYEFIDNDWKTICDLATK